MTVPSLDNPAGQPYIAPMKTLTVGVAGADLIGADSKAIQRAIDQLAEKGGGTVRVLPGTYTCFDAIRLRSNIRLIGNRSSAVLVHGPVPASRLAVDADIGEKQITPVSTEGFRAGMGIILRDRTKPNGMSTMPLLIERVENGILYLNNWITHDWCAENDGCVVAYAPLIHAYEAENIVVDGFTLDGSVGNPPAELDGLWGGNLYFRRVQNIEIRNVISHHACGDGIRFGQSSGITVEDCDIHHNSHYGAHPGSHSCPVRFSRLHIHHNGSDGLYLCWGVQNSRFEDCDIHHNGWRIYRNGISVGHKDTGNLFVRNHVHENWKYGVAIRIKTEANGAHNNVFRDNLIENNGSRKEDIPPNILKALPRPEEELASCGVDIKGITHGLVFENNMIRETRASSAQLQRIGIRIHPGVSEIRMQNNTIEGHPDGNTVDLR